jgi:WD40 repeat protein
LKHNREVNHVSFSPNGSLVATASWDKTARIWDATTGKELVVLKHDRNVKNVSISQDGKRVATASEDKTARIWDTTTGKELAVLKHNRKVNHVSFGPDRKRVASVSEDRTARIWKVFPTTQELIDHARSILPRAHQELTLEERKRFFLSVN